jgi:hypothetical protein
MEPKEKADELFRKMYQTHSVSSSDITKYFAKQCALIAVDEILKAIGFSDNRFYWNDVKQEIEKL